MMFAQLNGYLSSNDNTWLDDLVERRKRGEAPTAESIAS